MKASVTEHSLQMVALLRALMADSGLSLADISSHLGRSTRTAQRILNELRAQGVPLEEEVVEARSGRKRYRLPRDWAPVPLQLEAVDVIALRSLVAAAGPDFDGPYAADVDRLEAKLRSALSPSQNSLVDRVAPLLARRAAPRPRKRSVGVAESLLDAARLHHVCDAHYAKPGQAAQRYVLEPLGLFNRGAHLYCVARRRAPFAIRLFRVDRFRSVTRRRERFAPPEGFDLDAWVRSPFGVCHGPPRHLRVRFAPSLAAYVAENEWHETQRLESRVDGSLELTMDVEGDEEILTWIAGFGDRAELLEPPALRSLLAQRLHAAAARYGPS